jgi:hypothetical protein
VRDEEYARRISRRDALLKGLDDASVRELESQLETPPEEGATEETIAELTAQAERLRSIFDHCTAVHAAEALLGGMLLMPGPPGRRKVALLTRSGNSFDVLSNDPADAERILAKHRAASHPGTAAQSPPLPKEILDGLCIITREMNKAPAAYRFLPREEIERMTGLELLATAFEGARAGTGY